MFTSINRSVTNINSSWSQSAFLITFGKSYKIKIWPKKELLKCSTKFPPPTKHQSIGFFHFISTSNKNMKNNQFWCKRRYVKKGSIKNRWRRKGVHRWRKQHRPRKTNPFSHRTSQMKNINWSVQYKKAAENGSVILPTLNHPKRKSSPPYRPNRRSPDKKNYMDQKELQYIRIDKGIKKGQ